MSAEDRLAVVQAALDQALASVNSPNGRPTVAIGIAEWASLAAAIRPETPRCVCEARVPWGAAQGLTLAEVARSENGDRWFEWSARRAKDYWPPVFARALEAFLATHLETA